MVRQENRNTWILWFLPPNYPITKKVKKKNFSNSFYIWNHNLKKNINALLLECQVNASLFYIVLLRQMTKRNTPNKMELCTVDTRVICNVGLLFVCSFWVFLVPMENFFLNEDVAMAVEGFQILTHARHSWPYRFAVRILERATPTVTRL